MSQMFRGVHRAATGRYYNGLRKGASRLAERNVQEEFGIIRGGSKV